VKCSKEKHGLYLHIPFCRSKCKYCHFYSENISNSGEDFYIYLEGLQKEVEYFRQYNFKFETLYVGGGTPNALEPNQLALILSIVHEKLELSDVIEKSIELNPEFVDVNLLNLLIKFGFNRISLGVQSFVDTELEFLGRNHNSKKVYEAYNLIKKYNFKNVNIDLIFAFSGQTTESFEYSLWKACELDPTHISTYTMTFEKPAKENLENKNETITTNMIRVRDKILAKYGFLRYEISNFAKKGYECMHNMKYWLRQYYVGLGPSASGFSIDGDKEFRYTNPTSIQLYAKGIRDIEILSEEQKLMEEIFLNIRTRYGWKTERNFITIALSKFQGLLRAKNNALILTDDGLLVADQLALKILELYEDYKKGIEI